MSMPLDPAAAPPAITPRDTPSSPADYAAVTPHGQGPAPYDIQAPMADLAGVFQAARDVAGGDEGAPTGAGRKRVTCPDVPAAAQAQARR
jgi:hypothetical protein